MKHKYLILLAFSLAATQCPAQKPIKIKPQKWVATAIPEPSDISYNAKSNHFFVASDNGILFETDQEGKVLRKTIAPNSDYEAVYSDDNFIYAVDETHRAIHLYDPATFTCSRMVTVPYQGARNAGYEAIAFNQTSNSFILITEKNPITLFELDADFAVKNQKDLSKIARDIASATYHNGFLWLLSDEDRTVFKLNPANYEVIAKWQLPVNNPEGLAFDGSDNMVITCDDMQRIYYFNNPDKP